MTAGANPSGQALPDCASEQLHLSGRIQAHGALIAADLQDRRITYASANTADRIGAAPDQLFDAPVTSIFSPDEHQRLEQAIEQSGYQPSSPDLYGVRLAADVHGKVDVILHQVAGQIVIEIERSHGDDQANLVPVLYSSQEIGEATSVPEIETAVARAVRSLTGFDRAMVYRFHDDEHGEIVAEDRLPGLVRYLGHHFPASDIPLQARHIYTRKASRYIPDVDEGDVAVVASPRLAGTGLDLSHAALRSVSPFHLEFMRNMDTAASVSFSMADAGRLTRLVSCTSEKPQWLSRSTRRACALLVLQAKLQVSAAEQISRLNDAARRESIRNRLRSAMQTAPDIAEGLTSASGDLLELCQADSAATCVDGQYRSIGTAPSEDAVRRIASEIRASRSPGSPWATDRLEKQTAHDLGAPGCLFVALSAPDDFVIWFRRDRLRQLRWLGDPRAHSVGLLNPRKSFDTWLEQVTGSSVPWTDADLRAARLLAYDVESAQLSRAQAQLAHLGMHDPLTGLPNRHHLSSVMAAMLAGASSSAPVAAIFIDLDRFKAVNDKYGHEAGDCVLREAARRIAVVTRAGADVVIRAGADSPPAVRLGGEFFVLLPGADAAGAALVAERIRQSLREPIAITPDLRLTIGASIGVALAAAPEELHHLLSRADAAMYRDKRRPKPVEAS
ncbi:sensor domain-containing diguanylate cyclase [Mycobacterium paragordonae]|uniref:sensor domain-containing diguanylate cyclase n=1 Tax=Mycobacterium paragordonae TaxID=1389713 RepID=UPI00105C7A9E|nr:sensor domain-containing diguanylate cyclase [Mycobacterium paragordonae]TDK99573.1 sensor domain-containing diguanylate cyclase [Mycobacterium paragordonae]TDL06075.1 sensor domain-containing diguanylate cyclase [Mycobacterium paragordonae]